MSKEVALVRSEAVVNVIVADDDFISYISNEFDYVVDITGMNPRPGIGWSYINNEFVVPGQFENGEFINQYTEPLPEEPTE